jgi:hypothetical protein
MTLPYTWKLHNNRPHQDYMCYWLDRCHREIGIRGVYIDESYCQPYSYNVLASRSAYVADDGTRRIGFTWMDGRDYVRRLKQIFTDHGVDYSIWIHTTNYRAFPVYTFGDISMDGEHPQIWVPFFDRYENFYDSERTRGYICGLPMGLVGTMMYHSFTDAKGTDTFPSLYRKSRSYLGVTLGYGVLPMSTGVGMEFDRTQNIRHAFGIADEGVESIMTGAKSYWTRGYGDPWMKAVKPDALRMSGDVNRARRRALLYSTSLHWNECDRYEVEGGFDGFRFDKAHAHAWNPENGASLLVDGKWVIEHVRGDFGMLWVEARDEPQKSRPEGVLLGVSFDAGASPASDGGKRETPATAPPASFLPDSGGGIVPPTALGQGSAPELGEGRKGKALSVSPGEQAVGFPVVPDWVGGAVQFDVRVQELARATPLQILRLKHHLDATVSLDREADQRVISLAVCEAPIPKDVNGTLYRQGNPEGQWKSVSVPIPPEDPAGWHRVVLSWSSGRYTLYWDGKRLAGVQIPAAPRLRDTAALPLGVILGNDSAGSDKPKPSKACLDSLLVYDWALGPQDAAKCQELKPGEPLPKPPAAGGFLVWHEVKKLKEVTAVANFARHLRLPETQSVRFSLFERKNTRNAISTHEATPWRGVAWARLSTEGQPTVDKAMQAAGETEGEDETPDAEDEDAEEVEMKWLLRVELLKTKEKETVVLEAQDVEVAVNVLEAPE